MEWQTIIKQFIAPRSRLFVTVQRHKHIIFLLQNPHQFLSHPALENSCLFTFLGSWALSTGHKLAKTSGRCRGKPPRPVMGALVILMAVDDDVTHKSMSNLGRVGCYVLVLSFGALGSGRFLYTGCICVGWCEAF